jgi:hypothetical protein
MVASSIPAFPLEAFIDCPESRDRTLAMKKSLSPKKMFPSAVPIIDRRETFC